MVVSPSCFKDRLSGADATVKHTKSLSSLQTNGHLPLTVRLDESLDGLLLATVHV